MLVNFSFSLLNLLMHVLRFELGCPAFLVHDVARLLLRTDLTVDVLELAAKPLRYLSFSRYHLLKLLVLHHLLRSCATEVGHL